jgi:hypothetical protein
MEPNIKTKASTNMKLSAHKNAAYGMLCEKGNKHNKHIYLDNRGTKHDFGVRILLRNTAQCLEFRRGDNQDLHLHIHFKIEQPFKHRSILDDELL